MNLTNRVKRSGIVALIISLPVIASAQQAIFTDVFASGSTTNGLSVPGGTPTQSSTSYDIASSKTATNSAAAGHLKIGLSGNTGSGFWEIQAVFAASPVSLVNVGDFINLTYTFTNSAGTLLAGGTSSSILNGLYNSGGTQPVAGKLANAGLSTSAGSPYATGNCQNWEGYVSRILNGGSSQAYARPPQNAGGTSSANQELLGNNFGSGAFNNPTVVSFDTNETVAVSLVSGAAYTVSYTIALTAPGTLTVTNILYDGMGMGGGVLFSQTNTATTTNVLTTSFDSLSIGVRNSGTSLNPIMDIGSIAVSANIYGMPGPLFNVTGGGAGCQGSSFPVGLNGSATTNVYLLYTNVPATTNIAFTGQMLAGNGSAISFGLQNVPATYSIVASNPAEGFSGLMIGSAVISFYSAPVINVQPSPLSVAANSAGVFSIKASGGGLSFQWYRNGNALSDTGEFSGTSTSNLLINPVTSADVAATAQGYYCVVTDVCGSRTVSLTNSLTLGAPANLTWQGGNPNTNWDLTTPNFINGAANAVVFHGGDNVTFSDTSTNSIVNITSSYVAPGQIIENASQNYAFSAGSASLIGGGSLVMNGSGTLTISNANAYTGGSTLNSGTLALGTYNNPLGTGPINLAGGQILVPFSGSASAGLSNAIVTAASSTIQFNQSGTYALVLDGALTGNVGQTLTLYNYNATTANSRVRLYGAFTNNANINLSSLGAEIEMAPYLPAGDQVYNGVISGNSGRIVPRGGGNAIFNAQNTYNDASTAAPTGISLLMSSGNVGFGVDSVASSPPTIDSGPAGTGNIAINVGTEGGTSSFFASGAAHTVGNHFIYTSATNTVTVILGGTNNLTLSGEFTLSGADGSGNTNRTLNVTNQGISTLSGVVDDSGTVCGLNKIGAGTLVLTAIDTYSGPTSVGAGTLWNDGQLASTSSVTVTNGSLGGTGSIAGAVTISAPGMIAPGTSAIGTLTLNNGLALGGNGLFKINKSLSQSNDLVSVSGLLTNTGSGTITITNLGPALVAGDRFTLFSQPLLSGGTLSVTGGGMTWTNRLAIDGSIQVLSAGSTTAIYPTNVTYNISGTSLKLGWPATHQGWILQAQTNSAALGLTTPTNTWYDVAGTGGGTNASITINPANPAVFFRLRHP